MAETEVPVLCYWNGGIKYGSNGVYYDGPTPRRIIVKKKIELNRLLDRLYEITGLDIDNQRSKVKIFGRYPSVVQEAKFQFLLLPVVNESSLKTMLEVTSKHPSIKTVELYLEVKSDGDVDLAVGSSLLANPGSSSKRQRTDIPVKLEKGNSNGWIEDEEDADIGNGGREGDMADTNLGSDAVAQVVSMTGDNGVLHKDLNNDSSSGVSKPCLSSLCLDDHDLRVGLCFKDGDDLKKAVDWCSIKGQQRCVVREAGKDECMFECIRWKCKWSLVAAKMEKHGIFEIIKYTGPHTCCPMDPEDFDPEFEADEIERVVRVQPTRSFAELKKWWKEKIGYDLETSEVRAAKEEAIKRVFGNWDQCYEDLPKLMSAFCSSNGMLVDWKYDVFPNPKFASFHGVFWAFSQSIEGFQHCRPQIVVETTDLNCKYPLKLMIASGVDAANNFFPLAFAVTKEVSTDSWRWFLTGIREKVTQRKGLCLISSPHPDIVAVVNEPGSQWQEPWAYHRFCLRQFTSQFNRVFPGYSHLVSLVKQAGSTSRKEEFDSYMKDIEKKNSEARKWLDQFPQHQWAMAHDSGRRYEMMEINTEGLFKKCRGFQLDDHVVTGSVLLLFDELRDYFDERSHYSRSYLNCGDVYTKPVMDKLEEFRTASVIHVVMPLEDNNAFQVTVPSGNDEWIVQLSDCTCTCGKFQSCKFPCLHALAVCKILKINPLQYVDDCYTVERLHETYAATFAPVPELSAWPEATGVPRLFPPVISRPLPARLR
ncbi:hypothetical protein V5N11_028685 [Cardamine amara subsp. amara]|uniref:SWIM-type domain-containing protein n=1 Tax=Cardamine amara subsp. amara TaxID=228776 RepID=A0ABD1AQV8_CARAN